ncbi:MAG: hypothetical protein KAS61_00220 [Spirochaetes bacterium]|nr:hypothetical protein [Spirochaetota bacterium]
MKDVKNEAKKFWEEKEAERGGKVTFHTFATFHGRSSDRQLTNGGLIYIIDDRIYFEDFERENWLIKLISRKQKYEKTEFIIKIKEISLARIVSRNSALNCIAGFCESLETKELSAFTKLFAKPMVQIMMKNGSSLFFDIMRANDFIKVL